MMMFINGDWCSFPLNGSVLQLVITIEYDLLLGGDGMEDVCTVYFLITAPP